MRRREFLKGSVAAAAGIVGSASLLGAQPGRRTAAGAAGAAPFKLNFAPHFGMFEASAGKDPLAELRFMHEAGFRAVEDNLMRKRPVAEQEAIGREVARLGMKFGLISAMQRPNTPPGYKRPQLGSDRPAEREEMLRDVRDSVEVAKRCGAKFILITPGQLDVGIEPAYQTAYAIDTLRAAARLLEPHGLTLLLEPLNPWRNHAGSLVTKSSQLFALARGVDSPAFKMLFDLYHLQISEGNLIGNLERCWSEIGYIQTGDVPGRKEPGTGEINYGPVFAYLQKKGWQGIVGTEHGNSKPGKEGDQAVIEAYRKFDA